MEASWRLILAERFRMARSNRAHVLYDLEDTKDFPVTASLPSLGSTTRMPGVRGWASWQSLATFSEAYDLEISIPDQPGQWLRLQSLMAEAGLQRIMMQRLPGQSLSALGHAAALVPDLDSGQRIWIDGLSWGWDAAYWALSLHPNWHLYGTLDIPFASTLAAAVGRSLSVVDVSGASPKPIVAPPWFGRTPPQRAKFRGDPAPTIWL
ncbi:MAG: hypothetical protein M1415_03355 [Firmicutes bacterium]|nr:hypothetical protein [Bacillota bacterium]